MQTAEGALHEVQDMLQRMNELAVKASNGTNSEDDRNYIQDEVDQLITEIDRVAETTKFNETYLLKGDKTIGKDTNGYVNEYTEITDLDGNTVTLFDICGSTVTGAVAIEMEKNGEALYSTKTTNTKGVDANAVQGSFAKVDIYDPNGHKIANAGDKLDTDIAASITVYKDASGTLLNAASGVSAAFVANVALYNADGTLAYATGAIISIGK